MAGEFDLEAFSNNVASVTRLQIYPITLHASLCIQSYIDVFGIEYPEAIPSVNIEYKSAAQQGGKLPQAIIKAQRKPTLSKITPFSDQSSLRRTFSNASVLPHRTRWSQTWYQVQRYNAPWTKVKVERKERKIYGTPRKVTLAVMIDRH